jgi:NAD-dependent deacetylase
MDQPDAIDRLREWIGEARRNVFFGGAGVSTESGIPDFRGVDGLYRQTYDFPPETILSRSFFSSNPAEFYRFYRDRVLHPNARANPAHLALAELERAGKLTGVVTQNIDGLHQAAGSRNVVELHGSVWHNHCTRCGRRFEGLDAVLTDAAVPTCDCGGVIEPDIVLYEDPLDQSVIMAAITMISQADLMIIGGTSLVVYPAAGLVEYFVGDRLAVINRDGSAPWGRREALIITEPIAEVLGRVVAG